MFQLFKSTLYHLFIRRHPALNRLDCRNFKETASNCKSIGVSTFNFLNLSSYSANLSRQKHCPRLLISSPEKKSSRAIPPPTSPDSAPNWWASITTASDSSSRVCLVCSIYRLGSSLPENPAFRLRLRLCAQETTQFYFITYLSQ